MTIYLFRVFVILFLSLWFVSCHWVFHWSLLALYEGAEEVCSGLVLWILHLGEGGLLLQGWRCCLVFVLAGSSYLWRMKSASLAWCLLWDFLWVSVSWGRESLRPAGMNRLPELGASCCNLPPICGRWSTPQATRLLWHDLLANPPSLPPVCTHSHTHSVSEWRRRGTSGPMGKENASPVDTCAVTLCQCLLAVWHL